MPRGHSISSGLTWLYALCTLHRYFGFLNSYILAGHRGQIKGYILYIYPDMEMRLRLVVRKKYIWPAIKRETTDFFWSNSASGIPEFNMAACFATSTTSAAIEDRWMRSILRCQARVLSDVIRVMQQDTLRWPQASLQRIYLLTTRSYNLLHEKHSSSDDILMIQAPTCIWKTSGLSETFLWETMQLYRYVSQNFSSVVIHSPALQTVHMAKITQAIIGSHGSSRKKRVL